MATSKPAGYSGTPLSQKLGLKPGYRVLQINPPPDLADLLKPLPEGIEFASQPAPAVDLVHVFVIERADLVRHLTQLRGALREDAAVWISWPKKSSRLPTSITEDVIRTVALPLGWVDIKVCAVSEIWSGLKLVVRRELRSATKPAAPTHRR
ncbi:MAG: DUF3052 family protein [Verrucomicrobia bacterium]|nr:DUF3052 family protein [Verrucomicrobiota bacterium]